MIPSPSDGLFPQPDIIIGQMQAGITRTGIRRTHRLSARRSHNSQPSCSLLVSHGTSHRL